MSDVSQKGEVEPLALRGVVPAGPMDSSERRIGRRLACREGPPAALQAHEGAGDDRLRACAPPPRSRTNVHRPSYPPDGVGVAGIALAIRLGSTAYFAGAPE